MSQRAFRGDADIRRVEPMFRCEALFHVLGGGDDGGRCRSIERRAHERLGPRARVLNVFHIPALLQQQRFGEPELDPFPTLDFYDEEVASKDLFNPV